MVIVQLIGGVGNQLFQYAAARRIAHHHNVPLKLDLSAFDEYKLRRYSLQHFNIPQSMATSGEVLNMKLQGAVFQLVPGLRRIISIRYQRWIVEQDFHYDPAILNAPDTVYLQGYWQSEKYFIDIEDMLRTELTITVLPGAENARLGDVIRSTQAVSIHVRRTDYVTNATTNRYHGVLSLAYYRRAVAEITERVEDPHFFIFSDDPQWTQANLQLAHPATYITHNNADKYYEDLRLMSLCQHHIIANSTFSWWGAWLCQKPDKIVIAPQPWFASQALDESDLIPDRWLRIAADGSHATHS